MQYLRGQKGIYEKAILLAFTSFIRISELVSLKYEDKKGSMLYINRASRSVREASVSDDGKLLFAETEHVTENRIKGSTDYGFRCIPLTGEAINLIESVHQQSSEQEYLFMYEDRQLTTITL